VVIEGAENTYHGGTEYTEEAQRKPRTYGIRGWKIQIELEF
jgi:hypothetical protein